MLDISLIDAVKIQIMYGLQKHGVDDLEEQMFRSKIIEKQMTAVKKVEESKYWHNGCHSLKTKKNFPYRQLKDSNVFRERMLESIY